MSQKLSVRNKLPMILTYMAALVCLVLVFVLPIFLDGKMLASYLPNALTSMVGKKVFGFSKFPLDAVKLFGMGSLINVYAFCSLALAIVTVVGWFMLIPMFLCKSKTTLRALTFTFELVALVLLGFVGVMELNGLANGGSLHYNFTIGWGVLICVFAQSILCQGGTGVAKLCVTLLSILSVVCLFDVFSFGTSSSGALLQNVFLDGKIGYVFPDAILSEGRLSPLTDWLGTDSIGVTYLVCGLGFSLVLFLNVLSDLVTLATDSNNATRIVNVVRHTTQLIFICILLIVGIVQNQWGIYLLLLSVITAAQFTVSLVRMILTFVHARNADKLAKQEAELKAVTDFSLNKDVPPIPYNAEEEMTIAPEEDEVIIPYTGPDDDFMKKLTPKEHEEFVATFLEKRHGTIKGIPDYKVGEQNKVFFQAVYIYLNRLRGIVSDSLMNKMYRQLNN